MKYIFRTLGAIWSAPVAIFAWLAALIFWGLGVVRPVGWLDYGVYHFALNLDMVNPSWYQRLWENKDGSPRFHGASSGMVVYSYYGEPTLATKVHEIRHSDQVFLLGVLQPILYVVFLLTGWLEGKDPYKDNPFEVDARAHTAFVLKKAHTNE